jgi:adenine-specific DNA-methyltransferase
MCSRLTWDTLDAHFGDAAYSSDDVRLYHGDCLDLMQRLPAQRIALTVTSPPYNIGKEYESSLTVGDYVKWTRHWVSHVYRLTALDGSFWLNLGYFPVPQKGKAVPIAYLVWDQAPFFLLQEVVWNYGAGIASKRTFSPRNEKFLWYVRDSDHYTFDLDAVRDPDVKYPNQKKDGKLKCNPLGKNPSDVWQVPKVTSGANRSSEERTNHPAQFPVALVERIILACSRPGDVVLDPFMGSGSVAEACVRTGRRAIGFEKAAEYVQIAATRIRKAERVRDAAVAQRSLFATANGVQ